MAKNSTIDDLIEKYLDGTISEAERELFDQRLKNEPVLSEKLSQRILIQKSWLKSAQHNQVKQHISRLIKIEKQRLKSDSRIWLVAASLIVLFGISSLLIFQNSQKQNDREFLAWSKNPNKNFRITQGQQNEVKKYGALDSTRIHKEMADQDYLPANGAVFQVTDTIIFRWPVTSLKEKLVIFDDNWSKVKEVLLPKSVMEYRLNPSTLKSGIYTWILPPDKLRYQFSIK